MICEPLYKLVQDCKSAPEVVKVLMDNRLINNSTLRYLEIVYDYKRNLKECNGDSFTAVLDTAIKRGVSERRVYRAIKRFRRD